MNSRCGLLHTSLLTCLRSCVTLEGLKQIAINCVGGALLVLLRCCCHTVAMPAKRCSVAKPYRLQSALTEEQSDTALSTAHAWCLVPHALPGVVFTCTGTVTYIGIFGLCGITLQSLLHYLVRPWVMLCAVQGLFAG